MPADQAPTGARELTGQPLARLVHALSAVPLKRETELGMAPRTFYLRPTEVQQVYAIVLSALAAGATAEDRADLYQLAQCPSSFRFGLGLQKVPSGQGCWSEHPVCAVCQTRNRVLARLAAWRALAAQAEGAEPRFKVIITRLVCSELPGDPTMARAGELHDASMNAYGAVSAILPTGESLGLKPEEFRFDQKSLADAFAQVRAQAAQDGMRAENAERVAQRKAEERIDRAAESNEQLIASWEEKVDSLLARLSAAESALKPFAAIRLEALDCGTDGHRTTLAQVREDDVNAARASLGDGGV